MQRRLFKLDVKNATGAKQKKLQVAAFPAIFTRLFDFSHMSTQPFYTSMK
jgi:hypothetical protein